MFSARDQGELPKSSSSPVAVATDEVGDRRPDKVVESGSAVGEAAEGGELDEEARQQEVDWKTDEEFKKFMSNPSIEAAIKLEKKRAERKLRELDRESAINPLTLPLRILLRDSLAKENERLEKAEGAFKALDLNKLKNCFGFDTFFVADVRRFGDGGIFIGNLRIPIEEVMPKLEKKLSEAAGRDVVLWFLEEMKDDI